MCKSSQILCIRQVMAVKVSVVMVTEPTMTLGVRFLIVISQLWCIPSKYQQCCSFVPQRNFFRSYESNKIVL